MQLVHSRMKETSPRSMDIKSHAGIETASVFLCPLCARVASVCSACDCIYVAGIVGIGQCGYWVVACSPCYRWYAFDCVLCKWVAARHVASGFSFPAGCFMLLFFP